MSEEHRAEVGELREALWRAFGGGRSRDQQAEAALIDFVALGNVSGEACGFGSVVAQAARLKRARAFEPDGPEQRRKRAARILGVAAANATDQEIDIGFLPVGAASGSRTGRYSGIVFGRVARLGSAGDHREAASADSDGAGRLGAARERSNDDDDDQNEDDEDERDIGSVPVPAAVSAGPVSALKAAADSAAPQLATLKRPGARRMVARPRDPEDAVPALVRGGGVLLGGGDLPADPTKVAGLDVSGPVEEPFERPLEDWAVEELDRRRDQSLAGIPDEYDRAVPVEVPPDDAGQKLRFVRTVAGVGDAPVFDMRALAHPLPLPVGRAPLLPLHRDPVIQKLVTRLSPGTPGGNDGDDDETERGRPRLVVSGQALAAMLAAESAPGFEWALPVEAVRPRQPASGPAEDGLVVLVGDPFVSAARSLPRRTDRLAMCREAQLELALRLKATKHRDLGTDQTGAGPVRGVPAVLYSLWHLGETRVVVRDRAGPWLAGDGGESAEAGAVTVAVRAETSGWDVGGSPALGDDERAQLWLRSLVSTPGGGGSVLLVRTRVPGGPVAPVHLVSTAELLTGGRAHGSGARAADVPEELLSGPARVLSALLRGVTEPGSYVAERERGSDHVTLYRASSSGSTGPATAVAPAAACRNGTEKTGGRGAAEEGPGEEGEVLGRTHVVLRLSEKFPSSGTAKAAQLRPSRGRPRGSARGARAPSGPVTLSSSWTGLPAPAGRARGRARGGATTRRAVSGAGARPASECPAPDRE